jgi:hypothetical protein
LHRRQDLCTEEARLDAPKSADRPEAVALARGGGDGALPVGLHAELIRREREALVVGDKRHRLVLHLGVQRAELGYRLALGETADIDPGHLRPLGELRPRAREREPEKNADQREDAREDRKRHVPRPGSALSAHTRGGKRRIGAHRAGHSMCA